MRQGLFHISSSPFEDASTECTIDLSELLYKSQNILDIVTKAGSLLSSVAYPAFLPPTLPTLSSPSEVLHLPSQPELLGQAVNGLRTF